MNVPGAMQRYLDRNTGMVSPALLLYLEQVFPVKAVDPTSVTMQQELVFQAGVHSVIAHLRRLHDDTSV